MNEPIVQFFFKILVAVRLIAEEDVDTYYMILNEKEIWLTDSFPYQRIWDRQISLIFCW